MIDSIDRKILEILQENARESNAAIARQVDLAASAVLERIRKLERNGVLEGYEARLNPRALGLGLLAYVFVRTEEVASEDSAGEALAALPEVLEVHHVAGEDCYLVKVRATSGSDLGRLLRKRIGCIPAVVSTRTTVVLDSMKETGRLPLEMQQEESS
ncbi:MAG: Lrp/AsnC family transcriptional regulator [Acidobacteriota bacterium]